MGKRKFWSKEDEYILKANQNGVMTIDEVAELFPERTKKAVKARIALLKLRYSDPNKRNITKSGSYSTFSSIVQRYKSKYGIILDCNKGIHTYDAIQWWEWFYNFTPNGKKLSRLPIEIYENENNLLKIIKYVLTQKLNYRKREDFLDLKICILQEYKIDFKHRLKFTIVELLNKVFPEYNFKAFEFKNVPLGYWKDKNNCDEYMKHIIEEQICTNQFLDIKREIPMFFTYKNIRNSGYGILGYCIFTYKHYESFYQWLNYLYPQWNLSPEDFKEIYGFDGTRLNSREESLVYDTMKRDLKLNVTSTGLKKEFRFLDAETNDTYIPDFIIDYNGKKIIVEYFGLYRENYGKSIIMKTYYYKTHRKIKYFNNLDDYEFIYFFQSDLKDIERLKNKIISRLRGGEIIWKE
jgi:hypothetical protein